MESAEWMARAEREYDSALDMFKMSYHRFALLHAQMSLVYSLRAVAIDKGLQPHETIDLEGLALLVETPPEISEMVEDIKSECCLIHKGEYWQDPDRERVGKLLDAAGEVLEWVENEFDKSCWSDKE
ncbi:MAG TPA: HEPN domain-containing protein [Methanomassiliicoccales archaeon]|jgi:HEPN domain-containing protein